jgi:hypothetical protein
MIDFSGSVNHKGMLEALIERFGKEYHQPNQFLEEYGWLRLPETRVVLEYNKVTGKGFAYLCSKRILEEQKKFDEEKAQKGKKAF